MKRSSIFTVIIALVLSAITLCACGKSEFGAEFVSEKKITISASNASGEDSVMNGTLVVADGETVELSADLTKGSIRVEIFAVPEDQSIEEIPEFEGDPILKADLANTDGSSATVPAGEYMVKATCLEKATGTVLIEVK